MATVTQSVSTCTDINNLSSNISNLLFQIYPNPTIGILNVELGNVTDETISIQITNAIGQVLMTEIILMQHSSFNISTFSNSVYFVRVISENQQNMQ